MTDDTQVRREVLLLPVLLHHCSGPQLRFLLLWKLSIILLSYLPLHNFPLYCIHQLY